MKYPEELVKPIRDEVVRMGFTEARSPEDVQREIGADSRTVLVFVNSVCGCSAGIARPGLAKALSQGARPDKLLTTFAGVDTDATDYVRSLFPQYPPSSPQAALFKDGKVVAVIQRHQIEGSTADRVAALFNTIFDQHCAAVR
ncbi:MAG TPA: BrxA/BrxB family bacilliredoxin [bacterium]|nr:BrxA/BrxB family bacilliredoxin [bacterium]